MSGITKRFPGVVALADVSLELAAGEVLALMGENGAGKSTLMKILGGAYAPDGGEIFIDGAPVSLGGVKDAKGRGIALIHQELMLAPNLDVASNIFLGSEPGGSVLLRPVARSGIYPEAERLTRRVGLSVSPRTLVSRLTAGQMQMVEIAKALSMNARIIIMDEPTSSLTLTESQQLFKIIDDLRQAGIGLIYISHRMEEVLHLADRITVLRDGRRVGDVPRSEATHDRVASMMVGREFKNWYPQRPVRIDGPVALEVRNLLVPGAATPVSFEARAGEVLGFAGLVGSGRTELMQTIFGVTPALGGQMRLLGESYAPRRAGEAITRGVYLAPEDRKRHGLVLPMSVAENVTLPDIGNYKPKWRIQRGTEARVAKQEVERFRVRCSSIRQKVVNLSGGNQQKVVLGKWLAMKPKVLIVDEPTRGVDVGAKAEIYRHMAAIAADGVCILMVSSDMEEVIGMSDRVVVMHGRRIRGVLARAELSEQRIVSLMTGREASAEAVAQEKKKPAAA
jgi:ribose transport system ATP-binding protein